MTAVSAAHHRGSIPISEIHDALQREWGELSAVVEDQTGALPLRTNTSTLVVIADAGTPAARARETLHQLASAIPSRVILFILDNDCDTARAEVWAHCTLTPRGAHGDCYDVIEVTISPERLEAIPNIVFVHRHGELPTFLIWNGSVDFAAPGTRAVAAVADRLVIDTESFDDPLRALKDYDRFLAAHDKRVLGSDLAWTRTSTWRELIAQSFDPPTTRRFVNDIQRVDIGCDQSQTSGAVLLGSWIVSRLGCAAASATRSPSILELQSERDGHGQGPTVRLHSSRHSKTGIRSVRILARSGAETVRVSILRGDGGTSTVRIESPGLPRQERVVQHSGVPRRDLIAAELMQHRREQIFDDALSVASRYCEMSEGGGA